MFQSLRASQIVLRLGCALAFLWFGIGAFMQPQYWIDAWVPAGVAHAVSLTGMSALNLMVLVGIFEILVAASLATGFFLRWFAIAGALMLLAASGSHWWADTFVHDVGLFAALVALAVWPERHYSI